MQARYYTLGTIRIDLNEQEAAYFKADDIGGFFYSVLPAALVEDYNYGLGFRKAYNPIVTLLENFDIQQLHITRTGELSLDPTKNTATISRQDLQKITSAIDNISVRTQKIGLKLKKDLVGDMLFEMLDYESQKNANGRSTEAITKFINEKTNRKTNADKEARSNAFKVLKQQVRKIASDEPEELLELRKDIELVTLEELIAKFGNMMNKSLGESHWQKLLNQNPFILNLAFGVPVIKVEDQSSVGGGKFSGKGEKIADYLVENSLSGNAAIVEIKTPSTKLLSANEYRSGMFAPSSEINGAVNQMLEQIYFFQKDFNQKKVNSNNQTIQSFAVMGILIAGKTLHNHEQHKSFELFRGNSKNVQIITFDELLEKLKQLHKFLSPGIDKEKLFGKALTSDDPDLPF
jgi:hypothetical protein